MFKPTILLTAALGKTGTATALQLLARGYPVRAMVHREDARSERLRTAGAQIIVGSLEGLEDLRSGLSGVHRAYFCPPLLAGTLRRAALLFAAAAEEARLEVIVALSQWVADPLHPALHAREKWLSNHVLQAAGVDVVTVAPGWLADNYMALLEAVAQLGVMAMPLGDGLNAPPLNEDIARVIVCALTDPGPNIGTSYRPTGPRLLAPEDIATTFANVLERRVSYKNISLTTFLKAAAALGYPDYVITQLYWFLQDYQRNAFGRGAPTNAVLEVGGSPPEDFEQIVRRYVNHSAVTKRTISAKLRAALHLMRAAATRAPEIDNASTITHAALVIDSPIWLQSHDPSHRHAGTW